MSISNFERRLSRSAIAALDQFPKSRLPLATYSIRAIIHSIPLTPVIGHVSHISQMKGTREIAKANLSETISLTVSVALNPALASRNVGRCYTMIGGKKYSIPPRGMVLKGRLQLGNMWQSDHLSRKRTPRDEGQELRRGEQRHLVSRPPRLPGLLFVPEDEPLCVTSSTWKGVCPLDVPRHDAECDD